MGADSAAMRLPGALVVRRFRLRFEAELPL
jgi:hypothetical protein